MSLKPLLSLVSVLLWADLAGAADAPEIFFKTSPRTELLRPFADPIDLSLLITGTDAKPVADGAVAIRLDAPKPGRFFSTDFPLVEGTVLNEMRLPLRQGRASWKYLFPIPGEYRLAVDFLAADGIKANQTFTFHVRENRRKLWALAGFSLSLLVLGFVAGRIFSGSSTVKILLYGAVLSMTANAVGHVPSPSGPAVAGLEIEPAIVGIPSLVRWRKTGDVSHPTASGSLTLSILHLEKQKVVFAVEKIAVADEWSMKFHFPDGAGYRINAVAAAPGQPPVRTEQVVAVNGVEPPVSASAPALAYFIGLIALGLGVGRWSKQRAGWQRAAEAG